MNGGWPYETQTALLPVQATTSYTQRLGNAASGSDGVFEPSIIQQGTVCETVSYV